MRGEYHFPFQKYPPTVELPPRARRILSGSKESPPKVGTTSACAENTNIGVVAGGSMRNYLRVRGEYLPSCEVYPSIRELPPRARRIPLEAYMKSKFGGTTSACAENTLPQQLAGSRGGNYLRVRGEYLLESKSNNDKGELPPRARRILFPYHSFLCA